MAKNRFESKIVNENDKVKVTGERLKKTTEIFHFIKPYRGKFITGAIFLLLSSITVLAFPYMTGKLIDAATGKSTNLWGNINIICSLLIVVLFFQSVFSFLRILLFSKVSENAMADVRRALYQKIISLPLEFFEKRRIGELTSRQTNDVSQLQDVLSITLAEFFRQITVLIIGTAVILITSPKLSVFMLLTFPVLVLAAFYFGRSIRTYSKKTQDELANANIVVEETFQAIQVVKIFTNELFELKRYSHSLDKVVNIALDTAKRRGLFISFIIFALFGGIVLVLWYGATLVRSEEITIGELTSFIIYTAFIGGSVGGLGDMYGQLQKTIGATERIMEILHESGEVDLTLSENGFNRYKGFIQFQEVSFAYPSRKEVQVLKSLSFDIFPGNKIALVGASGAGKSTIAQLLLRFYTPDHGSIKIDGKDLISYNLTELRSNIAVVPQEVILFGGTILENILYGNPDASMEEIVEAAKKANAYDFIANFPDGFNTLVGERGVKLSGGQKQRIAIARAILKNPPVLILDEATSALDSESEHLVQEALNKLMENRTTIIIAHRLSTIKTVDKILVIDQGRIAETGTHEDLLSLKTGIYSKLLKMQTEGWQN